MLFVIGSVLCSRRTHRHTMFLFYPLNRCEHGQRRFSSPDPGAQRLVTSLRHHDLLNTITYFKCNMFKEDAQTCEDALYMH